jgi:hypothetical protein
MKPGDRYVLQLGAHPRIEGIMLSKSRIGIPKKTPSRGVQSSSRRDRAKYGLRQVADSLAYLIDRLKNEPGCRPTSVVEAWAVTHDISGRYVSKFVKEVVSLIRFSHVEDRPPVFEPRPIDLSRQTPSIPMQYHYAAQKTREARDFPAPPFPSRTGYRSRRSGKKVRKNCR